MGCGVRGKKNNNYGFKILGHWQLREVDYGVTYDVVFNKDSTLDWHLIRTDGYEVLYDGTYQIIGDTLKMREHRTQYNLIISEITDSVMILVRADSTVVVFDRLTLRE